MKESKIYAGAIWVDYNGKKLGGIVFSFDPKDITGKKYVLTEEYYHDFLREVLNDAFVRDAKSYYLYQKYLTEQYNSYKKTIEGLNKGWDNWEKKLKEMEKK